MPRKTFTFDGKRYDITAATPEELAVKVAMRKRDLEEGKKRITKNTTVKEWAKEWKAVYKESSASAKTLASIDNALNAHILPDIGSMQLKDVKPIHCQKILNASAGKSKSLINKIHLYMRDMFGKASDNNLIHVNPAANLAMPAAKSGTRRAITKQERTLLLTVCETHRAGLWALIMLYCGLRPGETERVLGKHIDLKERTLFIDGTKTKSAKRSVPIPELFIDKLKPFAANPFAYVFTDNYGKKLTETSRRKAWASLRKAMHIAAGGNTDYGELQRVIAPHMIAKDFVPHCLRHTYCTDLQAAGVPLNVAKELMGHSSITMTANILHPQQH